MTPDPRSHYARRPNAAIRAIRAFALERWGALRGLLGWPGAGLTLHDCDSDEEPPQKREPWCAVTVGVPRTFRQDVDRLFPEIEKAHVARSIPANLLREKLDQHGNNVVLCWGASTPEALAELLTERPALRIARLYSGPFSIAATDGPVKSYALDWTGLYIDGRATSDFEYLGNYFPFENDTQALVGTCGAWRERVFEERLREDEAQSVVVIVQDRSDPALAFSAGTAMTPAALVQAALAETDAVHVRIVVSATPERREPLLTDLRASLPADLAAQMEIVSDKDSFEAVRQAGQVYTFNAPFAAVAVLAQRPVTVFAPGFFAGWGLTQDRCPVLRRLRALSVDEFAALMCLLYFRWISPSGELVLPAVFETPLEGEPQDGS